MPKALIYRNLLKAVSKIQNSLCSDSCIFDTNADSCELRVSMHPANASRGSLFPELVFIRPERTGDGMFSLGTRGGRSGKWSADVSGFEIKNS